MDSIENTKLTNSEECERMISDEENMGTIRDWRNALRTPPAYRVVNRTLRSQTKFVTVIAVTGLLVLLILYIFPKHSTEEYYVKEFYRNYNHSYPLSSPIITNSMHTFRIGIIADLDTNSKAHNEKFTWYSYLLKGYLSYSPTKHTVVISWDRLEPTRLTSSYSLKDRGMELSELVVFDGRLLTFDDRTGMVFEIIDDKMVPWVLLMDGDGRNAKGFKSEWATVKGEMLYVGSMGKEWTTASGEFATYDPMYIKTISHMGQVSHLNWVEQYKKIRAALGIQWPGYMIHESAVWSDVHKRWFFLPRRCSTHRYNETLDEHMGCAVIITGDEDLNDIKVTKLKHHMPARGFSSFKFIPGTEDNVIIALRTEELDGKTATFITAFTTDGEYILEDTHIADLKYEGLEFI